VRADVHIVSVGASHRRTPVALRERLRLTDERAAELARELRGDGEALVLSTCNRTEIYLADADPDEAWHRAVRAFERLGADPLHLDTRREFAAVRHLFRVAAGLDSLVVGETEIAGQLRRARRVASDAGASGPYLDRAVAHALRAGTAARAASGQASLAEAAVATLAEELDLGSARLLIVGAGSVASAVARALRAAGADSIVVANRTLERAEALAVRVGARAVGLARLADELPAADAVVSATGGAGFVVTAADVTRAPARPRLFVDLAVPRDLDPTIATLPGCRLWNVDELRSHAADTGRAEEIVQAQAERYLEWQRSLAVVPVLRELRGRAEEIRAASMAAYEGELLDRAAVEALTAQMVARLLHAPTVGLKRGDADADAVRRLFAL
jgi:glutamyl-tRNA reductase